MANLTFTNTNGVYTCTTSISGTAALHLVRTAPGEIVIEASSVNDGHYSPVRGLAQYSTDVDINITLTTEIPMYLKITSTSQVTSGTTTEA